MQGITPSILIFSASWQSQPAQYCDWLLSFSNQLEPYGAFFFVCFFNKADIVQIYCSANCLPQFNLHILFWFNMFNVMWKAAISCLIWKQTRKLNCVCRFSSHNQCDWSHLFKSALIYNLYPCLLCLQSETLVLCTYFMPQMQKGRTCFPRHAPTSKREARAPK